nr:hypothetical protein [Tanacetum cinerariifolium]
MVAILEKSDAAEGFDQIIDFLSGSYINHAFTRSGDVTRLQALVDKKRIVITEEVVHDILQLNDAEGVICLPNKDIFAGLARMGYEKPSTKLTFYKAFFSTQWKFFIHTILHSLSTKRTSRNEFSSTMASALICLSSVNTPRSDEDRLKLMELMVFLLQRNVCMEIGINAARLSKFLLSRKFDVTRLQALVDKKRIVITEEVVREILQLNDAEGVICLPNEEIFAGLARMGYEKPSTKLTFYKAFFSTQWKFFIHTILHSLSAKRTSWNEFSSAMASAVICLSSGQRFNFSNYIFESLVRNVDSSSKFYRRFFANIRRIGKGFSRVETPLFESMLVVRDVAEEAVAQVPAHGDDVQEPAAEEVVTDVVPPTPTPPSPPSPVIPSSPPHQPSCPPQPPAAEQLEIVKLKARVKKLEKINKVKSSKLRRLKKVGTSQCVESLDDMENVFNQGRIIVDMDQDKGIELVADQEKDVEFKGRHADKQAEIYNIDLDHSSKVLSIQEDDTEVQEAVEIVTTAKLMTEVVTAAATQVVAASTPIPAAKLKILKIAAAPAVSTRRRKGVPMKKKDQIEMDAEYARKLDEEINKEPEETYKDIDWNAALDHVQSKEPQNTEGYKMDFFKGMKYDEILLIFQAKFDANIRFLFKSREEMEQEDEEIIKSINETPVQKAAKRRKLHEQAKEDEDLKKQLEVVVDKDDDMFIEATLIGRKVPIVDYEIVMINNKPRYKIIRADDTHQLYISFITLLKNFDKEDLEDLWRIMKARFSTSKPTNFSNDYLLSTLKTMFEKTDRQDAIWRNQQSAYGQALVKSRKLLTSCGVPIISLTTTTFILLVKKRYLLSKFTLEQLVNVVRLKVEEESKMSLVLLRFTRQQLQEYQQG